MERYPDDEWEFVDIEPGNYCPTQLLGEEPPPPFEFGSCKMEVVKTGAGMVYKLHLLPKGPAE